jgi:HTH-type transcriptional regulator, competence development regulator
MHVPTMTKEVAMVATKAERLGNTLRTARELKSKSLKAVAEPADISTAYLLKLEKGLVDSPSPHILHRLAAVLEIDYLDLMRKAGYVVGDEATRSNGSLAHALSGEQLTDDEERALATYLKLYRGKKLG